MLQLCMLIYLLDDDDDDDDDDGWYTCYLAFRVSDAVFIPYASLVMSYEHC